MLNEPMVTPRRTPRVRPLRTVQPVDLSDEQEGAAFMAFLGEHQQFAATHRGA